MRVLALETTSFSGSVALLQSYEVVYEMRLPETERSAQSLAPAIESSLAHVGWTANALELIAVTVGPGSFTGLRVGVTTAKTLAYALNAEVLGVNTLEVLATQAAQEHSLARIVSLLDAQRKEWFAAIYQTAHASLQEIQSTTILTQHELLAQLHAGDVLCGPQLEKLSQLPAAKVVFASPQACMPRAATVGQLAWQKFNAGKRENRYHLMPEYYRPSYAEEKRI